VEFNSKRASEEDTEMMTWVKILVGILAAMCLLAVGALEVVSERRSSNVYSDRVGDVRPETWDTGVAEPVFTPDLDSPVVRPGPRMSPRPLTVLEVDEAADGQAQRIVLMRRGGRELEAAEK
jgi:hypothetical protein